MITKNAKRYTNPIGNPPCVLKKTLENKKIVLDEGIAKLAKDRKTMRADIINSLK